MANKMSLESALDEERREILDILQGRPHQQHQHGSQQQPARPHQANTTPTPPIRSMLDVFPDSPRRSGPVKPSSASVRSMLDPISPSPLRVTHSASSSPISAKSSLHEPEGLRRASESFHGLGRKSGVEAYQFGMLPSIPSQALPKRVTQGGKKKSMSHNSSPGGSGSIHTSSMAAVMSGSDFGPLPGFPRGRQIGRHAPGLAGSSTSPMRSRSPGSHSLSRNHTNSKSNVTTFVTDSGRVINLDHAYRKLSNAALSRSGGSLAQLPHIDRKDTHEAAENSDSDARLPKDYYFDTPEGGFSEDHSSDDENDMSSDEELWRLGLGRGRERTRKKSGAKGSGEHDLNDPEGTKKVQSLLAAAEEERKNVSSTYKVRSLLEPLDNRTVAAATERPMRPKTGVHPNTNFDITVSQGNTPVGSEDEGGVGGEVAEDEAEVCEIKKAQNLSVYISPTDQSVPNRIIRTIVRGDFTKVQAEVRRARTYLVATDLSEESVYALEWTIGTILRDGDTMYAIYAIDEEGGTNKPSETELPSVTPISDGFKAILDIATTIHLQTAGSTKITTRPSSSAFASPQISSTHLPVPSSEKDKAVESSTGSVDSRAMSKTEVERLHAIDGITETCVRLMRKTKLQVRVAVEVIHCKSPKHLITEAIDGLEPTLVILGSRGRSALKGVLLGSFSNYLVTKSSAPVMVARKKLKKHAKFKNGPVRFSNNLAGLGSTNVRLANAKID